MTDPKLSEVWTRIFGLRVGDKVRVKRISSEKRLQDFPILRERIGKEGVIQDIRPSLLVKTGWYVDSIFARANFPNAKIIPSYLIRFSDKHVFWTFMAEDLEKIE